MYQVTARVSATDPSDTRVKLHKRTYKGLFLPTKHGGRVDSEKVMQTVERKLRKRLEEVNPGISFKFVFTVEKIPADFCFHQE